MAELAAKVNDGRMRQRGRRLAVTVLVQQAEAWFFCPTLTACDSGHIPRAYGQVFC